MEGLNFCDDWQVSAHFLNLPVPMTCWCGGHWEISNGTEQACRGTHDAGGCSGFKVLAGDVALVLASKGHTGASRGGTGWTDALALLLDCSRGTTDRLLSDPVLRARRTTNPVALVRLAGEFGGALSAGSAASDFTATSAVLVDLSTGTAAAVGREEVLRAGGLATSSVRVLGEGATVVVSVTSAEGLGVGWVRPEVTGVVDLDISTSSTRDQAA